jgi:hypothetical protein
MILAGPEDQESLVFLIVRGSWLALRWFLHACIMVLRPPTFDFGPVGG